MADVRLGFRGYWRLVGRTAFAATCKALDLRFSRMSALKAFLAIVAILMLLLYGSGKDAAIDEIIVRTVSAAYLVVFPLVFLYQFVVSPMRLHNTQSVEIDALRRNAELRQQPRISAGYRFQAPNAELILTNRSDKTITGVEVMLRNYRTPDNARTGDVLVALDSVDGKSAPITLNPDVPTYFRIASLKQGQVLVRLRRSLPTQWFQTEVVLKIGISGENIAGKNVYPHLRAEGDNMKITEWDGENS